MADTKDQSNAFCIVYAVLFVSNVNTKIKAHNAFNAMFIDTVNTGVCGFYTTLYTGVKTLLIVNTKHIHTFLPITFSIFNRFSIQKKF